MDPEARQRKFARKFMGRDLVDESHAVMSQLQLSKQLALDEQPNSDFDY